jgi:hypothetical protein
MTEQTAAAEVAQHDVEVLADFIAAREAAARAEAWDEAVQALAWALDNGPSERALPYVAEHNPHRAIARTDGAGS